MTLAAGTRLGRYVVVAPIGAGGMGEVYRAHDERLDREVAVKVLPSEFAEDPGRLRRFSQEAQSTGALNHPNVLTVHDVGTHEGAPYLVSELLDGETLRDRLASSGRLPVRKACEYAAQVARGLAAAHARGVVHRDLKPDNLFITRDDRVKILDFGLAKLVAGPDTGDGETRTMAMGDSTEPGVILGTVGYMAPEQVRGEQPDHRADIFALGAVLYEMLTGERAFRGDTAVSSLNAILVEDPIEASTSTPGVTKAHDEIVRHCLEKSPDHRFQSAQDLAFQLEMVSGASSSELSGGGLAVGEVDAQETKRRGLHPVAAVLLALVAAIGGAVGAWTVRPAAEKVPPSRLRPITFSGSAAQVSASPDGKILAFVSVHDGESQIWLKQLPGGDEVALTAGPDLYPRFSPDGSEILFTRHGSLYRTSVLGRGERMVAAGAALGDWTPHGDRIAFTRMTDNGSDIYVMAADGSDEKLLHREALRQVVDIRWSPDGTRLACPFLQPGANLSDPKLLLLDAASGEATMLPTPLGGSQPVAVAWLGDGDAVLYVQPRGTTTIGDQTLLVRHDLVTGQAEILHYIEGVAWSLDVLGDGEAVMGVDSFRGNLQEVALAGSEAPPRWLTLGDSLDRQPVYSPDGAWLAFSSNRTGNLDVWALNLESGEVRRLTDHPGADWDPYYTADGRHLVWSSDRDGHFEIWMAETDGRNPQRITDDGYDAENGTVTPDGRYVIYNSTHPEKSGVWRHDLETDEVLQLAAGLTGVPEVSPDGSYTTVVRSEGLGQASIEVVRVADGVPTPFRIDCVMDANMAGALVVGRARWMPDGRSVAFVCQDEAGRAGVFVQDFSSDRDTDSSRRYLAGYHEGRIPESFGIAPDGRSVALALTELRQSLMLADQLPGVSRPAP